MGTLVPMYVMGPWVVVVECGLNSRLLLCQSMITHYRTHLYYETTKVVAYLGT